MKWATIDKRSIHLEEEETNLKEKGKGSWFRWERIKNHLVEQVTKESSEVGVLVK